MSQPGRLQARLTRVYSPSVRIEAMLDLSAEGHSITVLFGPSGSGKTTILRCLAGLERPQAGAIVFAGRTWFDHGTGQFLSPRARDVGLLFQDYALFPHLTVAGNVTFGLSEKSRAKRQRDVAAILERFGLADLRDRYPRQLSGGQQQRVALARALARRPRLLLLDEPLSALDTPTRDALRRNLREDLASFGIPVILVTHDRMEAIALADRVVVVLEGRVAQTGTVEEVFGRPAHLGVAEIVGIENVSRGQVTALADGIATVAIGPVTLSAARQDIGGAVHVCIRAEEVAIETYATGHTSARNRLPARIVGIQAEGATIRVDLDCGFPLAAVITRSACRDLGLEVGARVTAVLKAHAIHLIPCR